MLNNVPTPLESHNGIGPNINPNGSSVRPLKYFSPGCSEEKDPLPPVVHASNNTLALEPTEKSDEDSSNENTSLVSEEDLDSKLTELPPEEITK